MSGKFLCSLIEDLRSDSRFLRKSLDKVYIDDSKAVELANRLKIKLDKTEFDLNIQDKLYKYLPSIKDIKSTYKELYTRILFKLSQHRKSMYILHMINGLISLRERVWINKSFQKSINLIDKYTDSLIHLVSSEENLLLISTPSNEYASLPIVDERIFILIFPFADLIKPWKWVLLSHELGHLYFHYHEDHILSKVLPIIKKELREVIHDDEQVRNYVQLWDRYWLEELVSDIVAAGISGPAYLKMLTIQASEARPTYTYRSHPSLDARSIAQIKYMSFINSPDEIIQIMENVWKEYRTGIYENGSLPEYLSEELVEHVSQIMAKEMIQTPFIVEKWSDFKKMLSRSLSIDEADTIDIRLLIPVLALSNIK